MNALPLWLVIFCLLALMCNGRVLIISDSVSYVGDGEARASDANAGQSSTMIASSGGLVSLDSVGSLNIAVAMVEELLPLLTSQRLVPQPTSQRLETPSDLEVGSSPEALLQRLACKRFQSAMREHAMMSAVLHLSSMLQKGKYDQGDERGAFLKDPAQVGDLDLKAQARLLELGYDQSYTHSEVPEQLDSWQDESFVDEGLGFSHFYGSQPYNEYYSAYEVPEAEGPQHVTSSEVPSAAGFIQDLFCRDCRPNNKLHVDILSFSDNVDDVVPPTHSQYLTAESGEMPDTDEYSMYLYDADWAFVSATGSLNWGLLMLLALTIASSAVLLGCLYSWLQLRSVVCKQLRRQSCITMHNPMLQAPLLENDLHGAKALEHSKGISS